MSDVRLVLCTFPDLESARRVTRELVETRMVACVNLIPGVESIYRWQGEVETSQEVQAVMKTTTAALPELELKLRTGHPYQVPEIVTLCPEQVSGAYAAWVSESVLVADA